MKIMDDKSIRSALVPTPQPAAGWDDAINAAMATIEKMRAAGACNFTDARHKGQRGADYIDTLYDAYQAVKALRRETPAPAEGKRKYGTDVIDNLSKTKLTCRELARYIWDRAQNEPMFFEQDIARLIENERRAAVERTRPDTAEARLREAVKEQLSEGGGFWRSCSGCHETVDGYSPAHDSDIFKCQLGNGCSECGGIGAVWDTTDYSNIGCDEALSPRDEAKESEGVKSVPCPVCGGEAIHAIETLKRTIIKPDPSEPDRRERVARIIEPNKWELIDAARAKGLDKWASDLAEPSLAKADAILAALDGGR